MNRPRNVATGHAETKQAMNQQLSPANLLSGGGLPKNTNAGGKPYTRIRTSSCLIHLHSFLILSNKTLLYRSR